MKTEHAKEVLSEMITQAADYDRRGDVVMRNQKLKDISDLPLPQKYIDAALKSAGLK
jgi:hypothetical protein